ncbi:sulfatase [Engelhardtia mirabilis]|uniref:Arylsulfatase n=1 Tax=Engelhardtia mirabilis TaxID=2528011 RepID=A0A518BM11_9BACT|nr:Arylsulfatase [Planctomycetes bacterium Pla133]QDV02337.1 Arylsulfatase [Planctomycetes bacterium Pla86]
MVRVHLSSPRRRHSAVATLLAAPCLALAACGGGTEGPSPRATVRNVLLFTVDTLRADQLGCYGNPQGATPAADALAAESLRFDRAYSQATITNPSLTSMLTGLVPPQHGVHDQASGFAKGILPAPLMIQAEGIATGSFIANMCKLQDTPHTVFHDGWDERFCGMLDDPENYSEQYLWDEAVVTAGLDWIDVQEGPWFAWIHLMDPHAEHRPPPHLWDWERDAPREKFDQYAYYNRYEELREMPPADVVERLWQLYSAEIQASDEQFARALAAMHARDDWDRTAVIFSADHGEELFETWVRYDHGFSMTEGVFHVPLMVRAPGLDAGVFELPVESLQIAPTLLDLFEIDLPYEMAGASLLEQNPSTGIAMSFAGSLATSVRGPVNRYWKRLTAEPFTREFAPWRTEAPWFVEPECLVTYAAPPPGWQPTWLDVGAAENAKVLQRMRRSMEERDKQLIRFGAGFRIDDPELMEKLQQLGYTGLELGGDPTPADRQGE